MNLMADDVEGRARDAAFRQALQKLGWIEGRNVQIDYRCARQTLRATANSRRNLWRSAPTSCSLAAARSLRRCVKWPVRCPSCSPTRTILLRVVLSPAFRPGGNVTGFINIEYEISGRWLELLKQIDPGVTRAAVLWDSGFPGGKAQRAELERLAPTFRLQLTPIDLRGPESLDHAIGAFSGERSGGLVVTASTLGTIRRKQIISLSAQYRLSAVYCNRLHVEDGGLISYGPEFLDQ
jgi:putative ABC transport system substrate-binding protein